MKVKSINAYDKKGKKIVVVKLENEEVIYLPYALLVYALTNIKPVKENN